MAFDPLVEERVSPTVNVERHESGDPMIIPRGETEAVRYTRASSLSKFLAEDSWSLSMWRARYGAQGIAKNPDLAMRAAAVSYSTGPLTGTQPISARQAAARELDDVWLEAQTRAGINEAANMGTAGHSLTDPACAGKVHAGLVDVVAGYRLVTAGLERVASEVFVACDELRSAGTFDSGYFDPVNKPGWVIVGDTKTGKNYHQAEFEMQLATYARSEVYLGDGGRLTFEEFFGAPMSLDVGYLVHVSVTGAPRPRIVKLDLQRGWELAKSAARTRDDRKRLDSIGIGEKLDHAGLAKQVLSEAWATLLEDWDCDGELGVGDLAHVYRPRALALHQRFQDYWTTEMTDEIKRRLA